MLISLEGKEYTYDLSFEFETTNNKAEYEALLTGLRIAQEMEIKSLAIFTDSQLIVNQIKGLFEARKPATKQYLERVKEVLRGFGTSINLKEVSRIESENGENWMTPIYEYLISGLLPDDPKEARKAFPRLKASSKRYTKAPADLTRSLNLCHWGINILGPLPMAPGNLKFLAIAVENSTKWVEAKPITTANGRQAEKFAWEYVICRHRHAISSLMDMAYRMLESISSNVFV
ncbi:reverse transcriptase domain-containing protein [Tanacetum coccineum]